MLCFTLQCAIAFFSEAGEVSFSVGRWRPRPGTSVCNTCTVRSMCIYTAAVCMSVCLYRRALGVLIAAIVRAACQIVCVVTSAGVAMETVCSSIDGCHGDDNFASFSGVARLCAGLLTD